GREVWRIAPGPNGVFDGPANHVPAGDDVVTHFDTEQYGITDPEGGDYNPEKGTLGLIRRGFPAKNSAYNPSPDGVLLRTIALSTASPDKPAGVAYGPGSTDSRRRSLYIVDRGGETETH